MKFRLPKFYSEGASMNDPQKYFFDAISHVFLKEKGTSSRERTACSQSSSALRMGAASGLVMTTRALPEGRSAPLALHSKSPSDWPC